MKPKNILLVLLLPLTVLAIGGLLLFPVTDLHADDDQAIARALSQRGDILSLEKISERARAERPGRLIDIDLERKRERWIYEVEMLDASGRVWELKFDARTGALLKMELDD